MSVGLLQMNKYFKRLNKRCQLIMMLLTDSVEEGLSPSQLQASLGMTERQVRYNIKILRDKKFIKTMPTIEDMRGVTYGVHDNLW